MSVVSPLKKQDLHPRTRSQSTQCRRPPHGCSQAQLRVATLCLSPGDTEDTDIRDRIRIRIHPGKTLKLHFPEGYGVCPTSTTEVEPLSDHGAPPRARRIAAAHVALPRASRHFSARLQVVDF